MRPRGEAHHQPFLSFQSLFYNICSQFFIFPKFCSNFFILGFLFIFFLIFLFQIFDTNVCLQKFLHRYFCVLFSLPQILISILFVQNVFQEILFPNFYSNFLFSIFCVRNIFGQKILIQTFAFLFFPRIFLFFTKFCVFNFFLEFLLCHKF